MGIAVEGLIGQMQRVDFGGDCRETATEHGDVGKIDGIPGVDFVLIPRSDFVLTPRGDFVEPLRDLGEGAQRV